MSKTMTFSGLLSLHSYGDSDSVLYISTLSDPLAIELQVITNKMVIARYWVTERERTKDEATADFVQKLCGNAYVEFLAHYSEITGYLWTDQKLRIGGHEPVGRTGRPCWLVADFGDRCPR